MAIVCRAVSRPVEEATPAPSQLLAPQSVCDRQEWQYIGNFVEALTGDPKKLKVEMAARAAVATCDAEHVDRKRLDSNLDTIYVAAADRQNTVTGARAVEAVLSLRDVLDLPPGG